MAPRTLSPRDLAQMIDISAVQAFHTEADVRDVAAAYLAAAAAPGIVPGGRYNLSTANPVSIRDILDRLIALSSVDVEVVVDAERYRPNHVEVASGDNGRAFEAFGWTPRIALTDTLRDVLDFQRNLL